MAKNASLSPGRVSGIFCAEDADIIFQSSDRVLFRIHKTNLKVCTEGFSPPKTATFDEYVPLTETSSVLELLFQFIYPMIQPALDQINLKLLASLAEAAEKYQIYSAMAICKIHMSKTISQHPESVLAYALKHNHTKIARQTTPFLLHQPLEKTVARLPIELVIPWVKYTGQWGNVARAALTFYLPADFTKSCKSCRKPSSGLEERLAMDIIVHLSRGSTSLQNLDHMFPLNIACCAQGSLQIWRDSLKAGTGRIQSFKEFLERPRLAGGCHQAATITGIDGQGPKPDHGTKKRHNIFSATDADITYESSDGVLFRIHEVNLKTCSKGFPISDRFTSEETRIVLTESSSTLELLFQFVYPMPQPEMGTLEFGILEPLAAAAEKYQVYAAMAMCRIYMRHALPQHATAVMKYAVKSNYYDIMNAAAPLYIDKPLEAALEEMPTKLIVPWVQYYESWNQVARNAIAFHSSVSARKWSTNTNGITNYYAQCYGCKSPVNRPTMEIMCRLADGPRSLHDLDRTLGIENACCKGRKEDLFLWRQSIEKDIRAIPKFDTFFER